MFKTKKDPATVPVRSIRCPLCISGLPLPDFFHGLHSEPAYHHMPPSVLGTLARMEAQRLMQKLHHEDLFHLLVDAPLVVALQQPTPPRWVDDAREALDAGDLDGVIRALPPRGYAGTPNLNILAVVYYAIVRSGWGLARHALATLGYVYHELTPTGSSDMAVELAANVYDLHVKEQAALEAGDPEGIDRYLGEPLMFVYILHLYTGCLEAAMDDEALLRQVFG